jgi:hypothetical protein
MRPSFPEEVDFGSTLLAKDPIGITERISGFKFAEARQASENETVREKYTLTEDLSSGLQSWFVINIDFVSANECGQNKRQVHFVDVDVSSVRRIDVKEIEALVALSNNLVERYDLEFNGETKSSRALVEFGELGRIR